MLSGPERNASDGRERVVEPDESYRILRNLSSPLVAVTTRRGDERNGMIANSAVRASLVPGRQRVAHYVFKRHLTHEHLVETGRYVLHLLARDQWEEIRALGFRSGREEDDKLAALPVSETRDGLPVLPRSVAWMECRVVNVMDAGASTFFMGEIDRMERGSGDEIMDGDFFRENMPDAWREAYRENLRAVQEWAAEHEPEVDDGPWRRLQGESET